MVKFEFSRKKTSMKQRTRKYLKTHSVQNKRKHARGGSRLAQVDHSPCVVPTTAPVVPTCIPDVDVSAFKSPCNALATSPLFAPFPCSSKSSMAKGGRRLWKHRPMKRRVLTRRRKHKKKYGGNV